MNRLSYVDRATWELIRRYEHDHPGSLVHVDVEKLGNIPDGDGWRYVGRRQGDRNRAVAVAWRKDDQRRAIREDRAADRNDDAALRAYNQHLEDLRNGRTP